MRFVKQKLVTLSKQTFNRLSFKSLLSVVKTKKPTRSSVVAKEEVFSNLAYFCQPSHLPVSCVVPELIYQYKCRDFNVTCYGKIKRPFKIIICEYLNILNLTSKMAKLDKNKVTAIR